MFRFALPVTALFLMVSCSPSAEQPVDNITEGEWLFSLANPVVGHQFFNPFSGGSRLRMINDSLEVTEWWTRKVHMLPLLPEGIVTDSLSGYTVGPGVGSTLRVASYAGDSLSGEWIYERPAADRERLPFGALTGKSYLFNYPDTDTMRVYFGETKKMYLQRDKNKKVEYALSHQPSSATLQSKIQHGSVHWSSVLLFMPSSPRGELVHFSMESTDGGFNRYRYELERRADGSLAAVWYDQEKDKYLSGEVTLAPAPPIAPPGATAEDFARFVNTGEIKIDDTYPIADSADVSYLYEQHYYKSGGLEYSELAELEITFEPGGDFVLFVRDRPVEISRWRLTADGSFVELLNKEGVITKALPILSWTDDHIDFRLPLKVKTREPRGVALESFAVIDAYVRVKKAEVATSSR